MNEKEPIERCMRQERNLPEGIVDAPDVALFVRFDHSLGTPLVNRQYDRSELNKMKAIPLVQQRAQQAPSL